MHVRGQRDGVAPCPQNTVISVELRRRFAERPLQRECLAELNRLFRAVALRAFPDTACASLEGSAWVDFIRSLLPENPNGIEEDGLAALVSGPYERMPSYDSDALFGTARQWVRRYG